MATQGITTSNGNMQRALNKKSVQETFQNKMQWVPISGTFDFAIINNHSSVIN